MSSKFCYFFIVLIVTQTCTVRSRIVGQSKDDSSVESSSSESNEHGLGRTSNTKSTRNSSPVKELSDEEIEQMKNQLSKELTPLQIEEFGKIMNKFKKGTTTKDHVEGMVELMIFAVAVKSNATDVDITRLFNGGEQTTTVNSVTLNNI